MAEKQYIGVFDSGVGGISVLRQLRKLMPDEKYIYYGDSANAPYGSRATEEVRALTLAAAEKLVTEYPVKALVIACNTATGAAAATLRKELDIPVVAMEPALKPAADRFPGGAVGVMATPATLREEKFARLLALTRHLAENPDLQVDEAVYRSEKLTGSKNRALAYMLTAYGMITDPVEEILDCYFRACSILVNCRDLARIGHIFAKHGVHPETWEHLFPAEYARYVNATMATCGMYDGSGEFAVRVGIPTKSGIGFQLLYSDSDAM